MKSHCKKFGLHGVLFLMSSVGLYETPVYAQCPLSEPHSEPSITVAVSLSMSDDALDRIVRDVAKVKGRVVVRGVAVPRKSAFGPFFSLSESEQGKTKALFYQGFKRLSRFSTRELAIEIDPIFFKRHAIDAVPVFVLAHQKDACLLRGHVTLDWALDHWEKVLSQKTFEKKETLIKRLNEWKTFFKPH